MSINNYYITNKQNSQYSFNLILVIPSFERYKKSIFHK
jgi:hypothetical protein